MIFLIALLLLMGSFSHAETKTRSLKINVISHDNGVGLTTDYAILKEALEAMGHRTEFYHFMQRRPLPEADINIFIEKLRNAWLKKAKINWFIPNPEWYIYSLENLTRLDLILCRTKENENIFIELKAKTYYLGFSSFDKYDPLITKDFSKCLHLAGSSTTKNTKNVLQTWVSNPNLPLLHLLKHQEGLTCASQNVHIINQWMESEDLKQLQNECGIHVCPSESKDSVIISMKPCQQELL